MNSANRRLLICLFGLSLGAVFLGGQSPFSQIITFGDSLSDVGNVFAASAGTSPLPDVYTDGTYTGRFTNGLNWIDYSAQNLGLSMPTPSLLGGTNFAFGGAQTGTGDSALGTPNVGKQIDAFTLAVGAVPANSLITLWAGGNDYLGTAAPDPNVIVGNLITHLTDLTALGGDHFVVGNLPDLSLTPTAKASLDPPSLAGLQTLVGFHNSLLAAGLWIGIGCFLLTVCLPRQR